MDRERGIGGESAQSSKGRRRTDWKRQSAEKERHWRRECGERGEEQEASDAGAQSAKESKGANNKFRA